MENKKFSGIFIPRATLYLWIILSLDVVIALLDWRVSIPVTVLLAFLVYHYFRSNYIRQREITKYIENLTFNIDTATKDTLLNFPMPLVVIELDGTIIWYNSSFRKIFEGEHLLEKTISTFIEQLQPDGLVVDSPNIAKQVEVNNSNYLVLGNFVKVEGVSEAGNYILLLYFVDNTELVSLKRRYTDEKLVVGIIVMDNYDDLMQSMEDSFRPQVLAEVEKRIVRWMAHTSGLLKKYERDKYLILFEYQYLKELEDKKFEILDLVKDINMGNKIPVTLSMGFGINGQTLAQNFSFAGASIDIALGRGGDQVVVKNGENVSFFGGKTRELEKRTRVKARVIAYALRELIDQSSNVLIMGHENADIDALGAALGIYRIVKNRNREAHIVLNYSNSSIESLVSKIDRSQEYQGLFVSSNEAVDMLSKKTLLVIVDTYRPSFTECPRLLELTDRVVVIDHHRKGADFIQDAVLTYQETYASSACEMVTEILQYVDEGLKLRPVEAEALYAGIVIDTKSFTFKTGVRTFDAASYLRKQGVDTVAVKQLFQNDINTYLSISGVVREAEIIGGRIAISVCPPNVKNGQLIAAKSADELLNLSGITAAFVLCTAGGEVGISGRSLGDINVQVILEKLGGGGHLTVAGAQITGLSLEEAREQLKSIIVGYMEEGSKDESR